VYYWCTRGASPLYVSIYRNLFLVVAVNYTGE
jgi:hypothetical protein